MTSAYDQGVCPEVQIRHRLRIAREHAGLDQGQLAELIGVSRNTVSNAETGAVQARKIVLNAWALACGVAVTWILTGKQPGGDDPPSSTLWIISGSLDPPRSKDRRPQRCKSPLNFVNTRRLRMVQCAPGVTQCNR